MARTRLLAGLAGGALAAAASGAYAFRRRAAAQVGGPAPGAVHAHGAVTVRGTPEEVYARWRDLPKLPHVLSHLRDVRVLDQQRSRWTAGADGRTLTWDVEITDDVPGRELAWRSLPPAAVPTEGHVRFSPARGGRGTAVHLDLSYSPAPGRDAEAAIFAAASERCIRRDLRRFKRGTQAG
jgi:uncharacterized membrane protein